MNLQEQKIFEEVNSFFGVKTEKKNQRLYMGSEHVSGYIEDQFKLKMNSSDYFDPVVTAFNKTHKSKSLTDPGFKVNLKQEMVNRGVPSLDIEKSMDVVDKINDKLEKEFDISKRKDAGSNPNMNDLVSVSQPPQDIEFESVKPRKGHTMKSNISGKIPDKTN